MANGQAQRDRRALAAGRRKARHFAVQALYQWDMTDNALITIEQHFRNDFDLSGIDNEYFRELLHEIPAQVSSLDALYAPLLDRELGQLGVVERALLRIGTYEFLHRVDVPYRVVIDEAVSLAKKFGATDSFKFINGVLDRLAQELRAPEAKAR